MWCFSVLLRWFLYFYCSACLANKKVKNYFKQRISKLENETITETKLSLRSHWVYYYLILIKMIICSISQCLIYVASLNPHKNLGSGQRQAYYSHLPNKNLRLQGVKWIELRPSESNSGDFSTLPPHWIMKDIINLTILSLVYIVWGLEKSPYYMIKDSLPD